MTKKVSFRIRRVYFNQIVAGDKKEEIRSYTKFWADRLLTRFNDPKVAVFVCGKDVHRRWIKRIYVAASAEEVLGRPLSPQGEKDIYTKEVIVIELGEVYSG